MSADNIIYVKKIKSKWWVWHGFVSDDSMKPAMDSKNFTRKSKALLYAHKLHEKIAYVEYGVCVI